MSDARHTPEPAGDFQTGHRADPQSKSRTAQPQRANGVKRTNKSMQAA
jgi:hypothetical protein